MSIRSKAFQLISLQKLFNYIGLLEFLIFFSKFCNFFNVLIERDESETIILDLHKKKNRPFYENDNPRMEHVFYYFTIN
jgi:hypothetical protein